MGSWPSATSRCSFLLGRLRKAFANGDRGRIASDVADDGREQLQLGGQRPQGDFPARKQMLLENVTKLQQSGARGKIHTGFTR